jgi:hypothetical protein
MTKQEYDVLNALYAAARTDEKGQWWPIRKWMDERNIFNDDIQSYQRLSEIVLKYLLQKDSDV